MSTSSWPWQDWQVQTESLQTPSDCEQDMARMHARNPLRVRYGLPLLSAERRGIASDDCTLVIVCLLRSYVYTSRSEHKSSGERNNWLGCHHPSSYRDRVDDDSGRVPVDCLVVPGFVTTFIVYSVDMMVTHDSRDSQG